MKAGFNICWSENVYVCLMNIKYQNTKYWQITKRWEYSIKIHRNMENFPTSKSTMN
jgi:hypothetical protein